MFTAVTRGHPGCVLDADNIGNNENVSDGCTWHPGVFLDDDSICIGNNTNLYDGCIPRPGGVLNDENIGNNNNLYNSMILIYV